MSVESSIAFDAAAVADGIQPRVSGLTGNDGARVIHLRAGETLFRSGARARDVYYISEGLVRAEHGGGAAREVLGTFGRGDVIGLTFLRVTVFTIVGVRPTRLVAYSASDLSRAVAERRRAVARLAFFAAKPLSNVLGFLHVCGARLPEARVAAYVLLQFDRRGDVHGDSETIDLIETVDLKGSPSEWALLLDVTVDDIEHGLGKLISDSVLRRLDSTRVALLNRKRLEELAGILC